MDLATHLKSFLTPGQIETLTLALENIEVRASMRATPPKSSEPEKFPTPASDSVKGEVDKFGRPIIERLGGAFIVKCEDGSRCFGISRGDGFAWCHGAEDWFREQNGSEKIGEFDIDRAREELKHAAASLETPKHEDEIDAMRRAWNGVSTTTSYREDFLFGELLKLKREVAALKAAK